ncbi:MAG TPA: tRNA glutamyl-Q(34) synthetase GluQRS [Hyphomicrobiaceae bacterium]|nr:tRNA glutamyl-Q(34) synthetase GluQRS [Hyphomicrobiaceae bacterium]
MTAPPVFRFAPSPNGELHLGHALSALVGADMAKRFGGRFLVRIEDIDTRRCRPEYIKHILEDLAWLGIQWEEPVLRQSEQFPVYIEAARQLEATGVLYPCYATRTEIAAAGRGGEGVDPDGVPLYPGRDKVLSACEAARRRSSGAPFALRLDMARALDLAGSVLKGRPLTFIELDAQGTPREVPAEPARWGDAIIVRKDVPASYHLAVVVDDARQGVSHVTRGLDLYPATGLHRLLQVLLGLPEPVYHHHRLVTDERGRKLAKSAHDTSLRSLRSQGWTLQRVREWLGLDRSFG